MAALQAVIRSVPDGIPVILDAKRGDIASSARAYAAAAFDTLGVDAITVSPYLGSDALTPFLRDPRRGVFVLCKSSNPSGNEIQAHTRSMGGEPVYLDLARRAEEWNAGENLGLVVGATDPHALAAVRSAAPNLWLLAPGVGAQGGDLQAALRAGLRADGLGMIVPVSRGIARAGDPRRAATELRDEINRIRESISTQSAPLLRPELARLAEDLLNSGCVKFGEFQLKSGLESPIYFDLRLLASEPDTLSRAAAAYRPLLQDIPFERLAGLPYAGLPIATAIALQMDRPMLYPRKRVKSYGTQSEVEGRFQSGERVVLIDDLATTGGSKFEAIERLERAGLIVGVVVVLIDRESGAKDALRESGYGFRCVFTVTELMQYWRSKGMVSSGQMAAVKEFLNRN
jgi:uridine monophosphate synthetase